MRTYEHLDDAALDAKIVELTGKVEGASDGTGLRRIAGEGRSVEMFGAGNVKELRRLLGEAKAEKVYRAGGSPGRAIGVRF